MEYSIQVWVTQVAFGTAQLLDMPVEIAWMFFFASMHHRCQGFVPSPSSYPFHYILHLGSVCAADTYDKDLKKLKHDGSRLDGTHHV